MFADIGVLSSLLQGGFVRPRLSKHKTSELTFTQQGIYSCTVSLALMAILPLTGVRDSKWSSWVLYAIATGLSYTSATAVTGMMGAAAACCDDVEDEADQQGKLPRGKALGRFRSAVSGRSHHDIRNINSKLNVISSSGSTGPSDWSSAGDRDVLDARSICHLHHRRSCIGYLGMEYGGNGLRRSSKKGSKQVEMKFLHLWIVYNMGTTTMHNISRRTLSWITSA